MPMAAQRNISPAGARRVHRNATADKMESMQPVGLNTTPSVAGCQMLMPAKAYVAAIKSPVVAGRTPPSNPRTTRFVFHFSSDSKTHTSKNHDGNSKQAVANMLPHTPPSLYPKNVAALMLMGPGVICVIAITFENSAAGI